MTTPEFPAGPTISSAEMQSLSGAIHNGRVFFDRIQSGGYETVLEASCLAHASDWQELRSCFELLATYAEQAEQAKQAHHNNLIKMMSQHAAAFKVLADIQKDRSAFTSTLINAVVDDVRDLLVNLDDETGSIRVGDDASCPICTVGTVPHDRDKGPCAYHRLLSVIEDQAERDQGDGQSDAMPPALWLSRSDQGDGGWSLHADGDDPDVWVLAGPSGRDEQGLWLRPNAADWDRAQALAAEGKRHVYVDTAFEINDGQPDEAQEWADFDREC